MLNFVENYVAVGDSTPRAMLLLGIDPFAERPFLLSWVTFSQALELNSFRS